MDRQAADTQRVLWAVVAVSLLVIVVLAGGLYFLRPQGAPDDTEVAVTYADESPFDPFEHVRSDQEAPGLLQTAAPVRQVTLVVGDTVVGDAVAADPEPPIAAAPPAVPVRQAPVTVAEAAPPSSAAQRSTAPAAPVPAPAPALVPRAAGGPQYWIQVGSFSSRSRADDLQKLLRGLGYTGRVTPHDADGVTMHRVRIGPYASRPEADRLLGKLRTANDMDGWIARVSG